MVTKICRTEHKPLKAGVPTQGGASTQYNPIGKVVQPPIVIRPTNTIPEPSRPK